MISWQRTIYILCLAMVEATPAALPLVLAGVPGAWGLLIFVVLAGTLADWLAAGWLAVERQRPALLAAAVVVAVWAIKVAVGAGVGLLTGWDAVFGTLFAPANAAPALSGGLAYLTLLIVLYAFRRGTRLLDHDSVSLRLLFARAAVGLLFILGIGLLAMGRPSEVRATLTTVMLLTFFAVGLLAIALAAAAEEHDTQLNRLGWRGLLTLLGAIALILVLGLLFASLFGADAARSLRVIAQGFFLVLLLLVLPLLLIMEGLIEWIARMINLGDYLRILEQNQLQRGQQQNQVNDLLGVFPPWVQTVLQIFLALLPILIIVALYLLARRRHRRAPDRNEERESLWSWSGLMTDLSDLLAGLRRAPHDEGLRAALARLRAADPASRIRRSYIRLLLAGEAHERPRAAPQTPRAYAPDAAAVLPAAQHPIAALTEMYERARYHPSSATPLDADTAERAWDTIDAAERTRPAIEP
jgi:hypothetical protein